MRRPFPAASTTASTCELWDSTNARTSQTFFMVGILGGAGVSLCSATDAVLPCYGMRAGMRHFRTVIGLVGAALAAAFLSIGAAHSLTILATGKVSETELVIDRGRWELVAGSIAVFLAFVALIPVRLRRDWRTHGIYGAFVVSLFAEMFGFPLTAYLLSAALGLKFFEQQFMLYMYQIGMPLGSLITFFGVLLIILGWREVYRSADQLATGGIYGYLRHPQYLGIIFVAAGWLVHWPTIPGLMMWPILVVLYYRLSLQEEKRLAEKFGHEFWAYAERTPRFLPSGLRRG